MRIPAVRPLTVPAAEAERAVQSPAAVADPSAAAFVSAGTGGPQAWSWTVAGIPATGHRVIPVTETSSRVAFTIPRWAPFYVPVCRAALRAIGRLATRVEQSR